MSTTAQQFGSEPRFASEFGRPDNALSFSPRPYIIAGYLTILIGFGGFGAWAGSAPIASGVVANGTVSVESNRKTVQHLEGGIVSEIVAKEGDVVDPGAVVLRLDPTHALGTYTYLRDRVGQLQAQEARLIAENTNLPAISLPPELTARSGSAIEAAVSLQQTIFNDRRRSRDGQVAILEARADQLQEAVSGLLDHRNATDQQTSSLQEEVKRLTQGMQNGAVTVNQISQVTRAQLNMQGDRGSINSEIAKLRQTISETNLQIVQVKQQFEERAGGELRDVRDQLSEAVEKVGAARDVLDRTVIRAPVRGMLQNIRVHTKGGVIRAAEPVMDIIPLDDNLIVTAKIRPIDIDNVKIGLKAEVRFSALSSRTTPAVFGKVTVLSQDVMEPTKANEAPYYEARVEVDDKDVPMEIRGRLLPGMPADVIISTGERTFAQYIARPLVDAFHKSMREK
ncbi:HlyD family type I secretion periplasmic adaptor subunit [Rhizobium sp. B21/90]|uniref:HlyD family type I secretion periplasmic adaptor subunit n=1 Tax=Rhizobium sp. B21/90 TaxID=2819993 RepID=UPI001C5BBE0E|nr:HlyD family type I secretion periplasmic adaptor subunit [Rhizobium sp. B21/90]QYA03899.1 HlyD family type I secretion periplasmic adaptor subunit [Rhizobium sp. B21/90]